MRVVIVLLVTAVLFGGTITPGGVVTSAETRPMAVGFIAPLSGPFAITGQQLVDGFNLYLERNKNRLGGREVRLIVEDDQFSPQVALTKARKLVESDQVEILTGFINSAGAYAAREYIDKSGVPTVIAVAGGDDITQRTRGKFIVRTGWGSSSQFAHPFGVYVARQLGFRRVATIADDFAFGHEFVGGFQRSFEENGGRVVAKIWTPLGNSDFTPFLSRIPRDVDAVVAAVVGPIALRFLKQYAEFGLKARIPIIGPGHMTDEINLPQMGDEAVGMITTLHYSAALTSQPNLNFAKRHQERFKRLPSTYSEAGYTTALWIDRALLLIGGEIRDKEGFVKAMYRLGVADSPRGPVRLDQFGNAEHNMYIRRVDRVDGKLQNTVIHTYPNVSQFWTYNPEQYLKAPVYSRDNPACSNCGR